MSDTPAETRNRYLMARDIAAVFRILKVSAQMVPYLTEADWAYAAKAVLRENTPSASTRALVEAMLEGGAL